MDNSTEEISLKSRPPEGFSLQTYEKFKVQIQWEKKYFLFLLFYEI